MLIVKKNHWDDEFFFGKQVESKYDIECYDCEKLKGKLRKYGVEFGKEFGYEFEKTLNNKKIE